MKESSIGNFHYHTIHTNNDNGVIKDNEIGKRQLTTTCNIFSVSGALIN